MDRDSVVVEVRDTLREVTTVTVVLRQAQEPDQPDDTVRITQITDRTRASSCDRLRDVQERVVVRTDTVYVEKSASESMVVAGLGVDIDKEGNLTRRSDTVVRGLRWLFLILVAAIVLVLVIRLGRN